MNRFLALFVDKLIRHGHLEVETGDGAKRRFGDGAGPKIAIRIADRAAERELLLNPELALGELYMDGRLELVEGDLYDFVALAAENSMAFSRSRWIKLLEKARVAAAADSSGATTASAPRPTSSGTTITTAGSTASSSTPTSSIRAPISSMRASRSRRPSSPRSAISPPSC